jgi:hypothetical protein
MRFDRISSTIAELARGGFIAARIPCALVDDTILAEA